jgi:hypothetical protein
MNSEARRVLAVFRDRGVHVGDFIDFIDFDDAIVWEDGRIRDESVRDALIFLIDNEYLVELNAGLELTAKGESEVHRGGSMPTYSARAYLVGEEIVIKQASLRGVPAEYVTDDERVRHIGVADESGIAEAIRDAVNGRL